MALHHLSCFSQTCILSTWWLLILAVNYSAQPAAASPSALQITCGVISCWILLFTWFVSSHGFMEMWDNSSSSTVGQDDMSMTADVPPVPPVSPQAAALTLLYFVQCVELTWDTLWFQRHNKCYFKQHLVLKLLKVWRCCRPHVSSWSVGDLKSVQNDHFCREIKLL